MLMEAPCAGCGWEGGGPACRARFEQAIARDFSDPAFFAAHRMLVDIYSLQHPDDYCASAKSLAAHLVGLCLILEGGVGAAEGAPFLRKWLDGPGALEKPGVPTNRGKTVLADLDGIEAPGDWRSAVRAWGADVWEAYADLHPLARRWAAEARAADSGRGRPAR